MHYTISVLAFRRQKLAQFFAISGSGESFDASFGQTVDAQVIGI